MKITIREQAADMSSSSLAARASHSTDCEYIAASNECLHMRLGDERILSPQHIAAILVMGGIRQFQSPRKSFAVEPARCGWSLAAWNVNV